VKSRRPSLEGKARWPEHSGRDRQQQAYGVHVVLVHDRLRSIRSPDFATAIQRLPPPRRWLWRFASAAHGRSRSLASSSARRTTLILVKWLSSSSRVFSRSVRRLSTSCRVSSSDCAFPTSLSSSSTYRSKNEIVSIVDSRDHFCKLFHTDPPRKQKGSAVGCLLSVTKYSVIGWK
jgi:hypothetical protein